MAMSANMLWLCKLVHERSGIVLNNEKSYLIEARLHHLIEQHQVTSLEALLVVLRQQEWGDAQREAIESLTTNETFFFRDGAPFDALREKLLPSLIAKRQNEKKLRIWCGAASTGQEPFSVNMILTDHFPLLRSWEVSILATDLSSRVISRCQSGVYSQQEVERGLPPLFLSRHFDKSGDKWKVKESIRRNIEFRQLNLLDSWFNLGTFDIILLRNVMIYFDTPTKTRIFQQIRKVLAPDGYLLLGSAETPLHIDNQFVRFPYDRGGVFRLLHEHETPSVNPKSDRYPIIADA